MLVSLAFQTGNVIWIMKTHLIEQQVQPNPLQSSLGLTVLPVGKL